MVGEAIRRIKPEDLEGFQKYVRDGVIGAASKIEPRGEWIEIHFDNHNAAHSLDLLRHMLPVLADPWIEQSLAAEQE